MCLFPNPISKTQLQFNPTDFHQRTWRDPLNPDYRTTIFLGYTSNLISSGLRGTLRYLVEHKHVSAIVTTAGGIEEDIIKCLAPTYIGEFSTSGASLRVSSFRSQCASNQQSLLLTTTTQLTVVSENPSGNRHLLASIFPLLTSPLPLYNLKQKI